MQGNVNIPDSTITTNLSFRQLVLMNMQQLTNFPYIEKDFDALTDYELLSLVVKYLNDVIANQNEQNDSITRMYNSFLALQTYVNNTKDTLEDAFNELDDYVRNYFDNLDVQDEINNKLEQMLEDGELDSIIEQFLQSNAVWCFDTVSDMQSATNLINGSDVKTLGYHAINDGGAGLYHITSEQSETEHQEELNSGLYATLITTDKIYVEQFGAYGDQTHDDSEAIQDALDYGSTNHKDIMFTKKYLINTLRTITSKDGFNIKGIQTQFGHTGTENNISAPNGFLQLTNCLKVRIENLSINSGSSVSITTDGTECRWIIIDGCQIASTDIGINAKSFYYSEIINCRFNSCRRAVCLGYNGSGAGAVNIVNCHTPNLTTAYYVDTDSTINITGCCSENVATFLYQAHGRTLVSNSYIDDGFRQGFIIVNGDVYIDKITRILTATSYNASTNKQSEFSNDLCCLDLQNDSQAFLSNVGFDEIYCTAPEIKMSNSANLFVDNTVYFKGYRLLDTTQTNILGKRQQNYITSVETTFTYSGENFSSTTETIGTNYMGDDIVKYTNSGTTSLQMKYNYKVPKEGYYLFWLKVNHTNYDYDYVIFPSGCYVPSSQQMPLNKYRRRTNQNFAVNAGSENTIRPQLATYTESVLCCPVYITSDNLDSFFRYKSQQQSTTDYKTVDFIGITDFEDPFCLPIFK